MTARFRRVRRAVARPHGLGEASDRALRLRARERERPRPRPALGADGGLGETSRSSGPAGRRGPGGWRPSTRPARVAQLGSGGPLPPPVAPWSRSNAGSTSVSIVTPPASGRAASPCGSRAVRRGRVGSIGRTLAAGRARRDPQHRDAAAPADVDERAVVGRAHADAHDLRVAAQEEKESALRGLAQERAAGLVPLRLVEPRDRRRAAEEREVGPDLGEPALERRRARADVEGEPAPRLVERALARDEDAPQSGEVDRGHRGEGDDGQPAGGGANGLHREGAAYRATIPYRRARPNGRR